MTIKVSVIVPAYNLEAFIAPCLNSILNQETDFPYEVIVCNDASTDETLPAIEQVAERQPQLKLLNNHQNLGLIATMRRLLESANGEYIAYLDGDDLALPGKLQAQADHLDDHANCSIVYHESEVFDSDTGASLKLYSRDGYNAAYIPARSDASHLVRYGTYCQASSIMIRHHANLADALNHGCKIICDYPWHIGNSLYGGGSIDRLDVVLGRYRMHSNSFGARTHRDLTRRVAVTRELEQACRFAGELGLDEEIVREGVSHARFAAGLYFLRTKADGLFHQFIEESANRDKPDGWWFDERHRHVYSLRGDPNGARSFLGWKK
jgi:glycosyltransferase involved in cell wall biosynthesis